MKTAILAASLTAMLATGCGPSSGHPASTPSRAAAPSGCQEVVGIARYVTGQSGPQSLQGDATAQSELEKARWSTSAQRSDATKVIADLAAGSAGSANGINTVLIQAVAKLVVACG